MRARRSASSGERPRARFSARSASRCAAISRARSRSLRRRRKKRSQLMGYSLLVAQGLCGVELRRTPGGDNAGYGCGDGEDDDDGGEDAPVEGAHAVEHLAQELDGGCAAGEAEDETDEDGREAVG